MMAPALDRNSICLFYVMSQSDFYYLSSFESRPRDQYFLDIHARIQFYLLHISTLSAIFTQRLAFHIQINLPTWKIEQYFWEYIWHLFLHVILMSHFSNRGWYLFSRQKRYHRSIYEALWNRDHRSYDEIHFDWHFISSVLQRELYRYGHVRVYFEGHSRPLHVKKKVSVHGEPFGLHFL